MRCPVLYDVRAELLSDPVWSVYEFRGKVIFSFQSGTAHNGPPASSAEVLLLPPPAWCLEAGPHATQAVLELTKQKGMIVNHGSSHIYVLSVGTTGIRHHSGIWHWA